MSAQLKTRKPTGKPSWPILLLAGAEKTGKSYSAAVAAGSPLVGRTYWVTIGEDQPDEYGQLGDFDIVEHDGTYRGIVEAVTVAGMESAPDTGVPLLVVDSMTRLWDLITAHAQDVANARARKRGKGSQDADAQITMDLWNAAKDQWNHVMDAVRAFPGPVILTARLDVVAVMNDAGQPTPQKTTKVQAHKSLPFDVGAVIEMPSRGDTWMSGVRSVRLKLAERTKAPKDFSVDWFWRQLGLHDTETSEREHNAPNVAAPQQKPQAAPQPEFDVEAFAEIIRDADTEDVLLGYWKEAMQRGLDEVTVADGSKIREVVFNRKAQLESRAAEPETVLVPTVEAPTAGPVVYEDDEVPF